LKKEIQRGEKRKRGDSKGMPTRSELNILGGRGGEIVKKNAVAGEVKEGGEGRGGKGKGRGRKTYLH